MSNQSILRITRELSEIQRGSDLSLAVACRDIDVRYVRALIIGPPDTPYEFGFYEFSVKFTKEYPTKAPGVTAITTNGGRTRFNPNIYAGGKVCLSILGTWRGERGEEWSSAQGLESILISIQSLMSTNPYENEPGFEDANSEYDKKNQQHYVAKIRHESLRISVVERLEGYLGIDRERPGVTVYNAEEDYQSSRDDAPFEPFKDLCKRRFLWYYPSYLARVDEAAAKSKDGTAFEKMPFEGPGNQMEGTFQYANLRQRLVKIFDRLNQEVVGWAEEGVLAVQKELSIASNMQRQFEQIVENYKKNDAVTLDLSIVDKNPFVWELVLFGRPMTNLDGGMFRIMLYISPKFPDVLPRVKFSTPIFHHRVSPDGILCYDATRKDDMRSHIDAIIAAIEEEAPAYDPRTLVNPEAAKLFWGTADEKKMYNRRLRRSVQDSAENCF
ncbi:UBC-like protein [Dothidotthia symphoricarpi CBS 119687]|uniref:Ubiquitin-conjugating enzyme E2 Z n=1 Tax=Dothidotthia symphoricarpi CBS 119687 TaxID=1392245 RepID=A0A6A6ANL3_9PLEO|nr:UBC-like protein [Dothidotthia symphoricarpi CBS 119687]KAF2132635.1 UBC-like protein [Dothidotthia symphoricarpi CBS 119687]